MGRYNIIKHTSRLMAVLLVLTLLVSTAPAVYADGESGSCGSGLSWSLSAGTLTISGSGAMSNFPESTMAPWYAFREEILRVELPSGLTSVGDLAFYGCENLTAVVIPDSVTRIGDYAFARCSGMELLNLGGGVRTIGVSAFYDCSALQALRLPNSLQTIGREAFYRCESITTVTVPASVTSLGVSAFSYCKSLVSANVNASVTVIPEFLFYGCERLSAVTLPDRTDAISEFAFRGCDQLDTVYYGGSGKSPEQIQQMIGSDVTGFEGSGSVTDGEAEDSVTSAKGQENGDGSLTIEQVTVTEKENVSVSTEIASTRDENGASTGTSADITVTVEGDKGWEDAKGAVEEVLNTYNDSISETGGQMGVTIYVKDTDKIDAGFIDSLIGQNVKVNVVTQDGSLWCMDGTQMDGEAMSGNYDLSYTLEAGGEELNAELGTQTSFVLRFRKSAEVNAEVLIRLGASMMNQEATLFQRDKELIRIQSVVIDRDGYAHFYLASVSDATDYYIAMNLPDEAQEAIIPDEMLGAYGAPERYEPIQYEITGRTSSWNMTIGQVTWIMIGVLVGCVVIVGFVMFTLNKRKLKQGYIPELDGEDDD